MRAREGEPGPNLMRPQQVTPGQRLCVWLATGGGVGFLPTAPGTAGAALGIPVAYAVLCCPTLAQQIGVIAGLYAVGVAICGCAARALGQTDPASVVWDEIVTVPIVFLGMSAAAAAHPLPLLIGFGLHRLFDISKLPPVRHLESLPGGWGIMSDDVAAGLYGCVAFTLLRYLFPSIGV